LAPHGVRKAATRGELDIAARVLTDAFVDEAGLNWWLRQDEAKERARRSFFDAAVRQAVSPKRELWLAQGDEGAALWCPPGATAFDLTPVRQLLFMPLLLSIAGVEGMRRALALGEQLASHHPREPHAHLVFLGVRPRAQGSGVGSSILKQTLRPVDRAGVAAYLETTTPRNVELYRRHGFDVTAEFRAAGEGPRVWAMTRHARQSERME
jgi:ribosomal protein S18 acetylase RimI-like enzyme